MSSAAAIAANQAGRAKRRGLTQGGLAWFVALRMLAGATITVLAIVYLVASSTGA